LRSDPPSQLAEFDGVGRQAQRYGQETCSSQHLGRAAPILESRPRQRKHCAHTDLDRSAIQRIGRARREQRTIPAQPGSVPQDRADIGVVDDMLQHDDALHPYQLSDAVPLLAMQRGQSPAMYVEARYLFGQILRHDEDRHGGPPLHNVAQPLEPALGQQKRPRLISRLDGASDDFLALGDEQASLGLEVPTQGALPEPDIVGKTGILGVGDGEPHYDPPLMHIIGTLDWQPARDHPELLAQPVKDAVAELGLECFVARIDPNNADTAQFCAAYDVPLTVSANCVVVAGRRADVSVMAACLVRATDRADVNRIIRKRLEVRKISFAAMEEAVRETGMEYGGITPIGLPNTWPILVDEAVAALDMIVIGSGIRGSKIALPGPAAASLPNAKILALALQ
jgi:prolyl-tRNA editing enzyme YbaK/EbsC (Cys-tRNA(Pro) deacylase)